MELTARHKKLLTWIGYPLLALLTFLMTISYTFPYDRLEERLVATLEKRFDVSIASMGPTLLPGGMVLDTVILETRPDDEDDEPEVLIVDRVKARVSFPSLLTGGLKVDFDVKVGDGRIRGGARYGRRGLDARLRARALPLDRIPMKDLVKLPMTGDLDLEALLVLPDMRFGEARGKLQLSCSDCTIGDGETIIKPPAQGARARRNLFAEGGLTVPQIDLGAMTGSITLDGGRGEIEELSAISPDGELYVTGELQLVDPVMRSRFPGCVRFRLTEDFEAREPGFGNTNLWMPSQTLQDDGFRSFPLEGTFEDFSWKPRRTCDGMPAQRDHDPSRDRSRPSITLRPDETEREQDRSARRDRERPEVAEDAPADAGRAGDDDEADEDEDEDRRERDAERAAERRRQIIERDAERARRRVREEVELPAAEEEIVDEDYYYDDDYDDYDDDDYDDYDDDYDDDEVDYFEGGSLID